MKDKLKKAYRVAWRWPEVYSEDVWVIWLSRLIAIVIPASLVALTFLTSVPMLGLIGSLVISAIMLAAIVTVTVKLFYTEYPTVEHFQSRETRIREFFHGFPAVTDVPLMELEPDVWVAYGHVDEDDFMRAIRKVVRSVTEDEEIASRFDSLENSVGHLHARFENPSEAHWQDGIELCKRSSEGSFPITRVKV